MKLLVLILLALPIFFYKLGITSLSSWDEAWYGEIAKQIAIGEDLWVMRFNELIFTDHPPVGFWLIALGEKIGGLNEFGVRLMSGVSGVMVLVGVYVLGKILFNKTVGWFAAFATLSAPWFILRARTGNLDIFLTMFIVWSVILAVMSSKNRKWSGGLIVVLNLLLLTKTMVPFTVLPVIFLILWKSKLYSYRQILKVFLLSFIGFGLWVDKNILASPIFWERYFMIGVPGVGKEINYWTNIWIVKDHLYNMIGRWFWPSMFGICFGVLTRKFGFIVLGLIFLFFVSPFLISGSGRQWHLIPMIPVMTLSLFGYLDFVLKNIFRKKMVGLFVLVSMFLWIGVPQLNRYWFEIVDVERFISDEKVLSVAARDYPGVIYLSEEFFPTVAFYSDKSFKRFYGTIGEVLEKEPKPFLVLTRVERIQEVDLEKNKIEVVKRDRDKVLMYVPKLY